MQITEIEAKGILTRSKLPASDYCINPYIGCSHGCVYCYAKFLGRWKGHKEEWGTYIDIKANASNVLSNELRKPKKPGVVLLGSMTDAYQPIERKYELTRAILKQLIHTNLSVSILTKSDLITRDIDVLSSLKNCDVGLTISFHEDESRRHFEPHASSIDKRLAALCSLRSAGISTYVFVGPIFPQITDYKKILRLVAPHADYVMAESLNFRCGNWASLAAIIDLHFRQDPSLYLSTLKSTKYWADLETSFANECNQLSIPLAGFFRH